MKIIMVHLPHVDTNCFIVADEKTKEAVVIDPGEYTQKLVDTISQNELKIKYILLTHGHYDHILGVSYLKDSTGAQVMIHQNDADCLVDEKESLMYRITPGIQVPCKPDKVFQDGDVINFGDISLEVLYTPGHTKGSVCFVCEKERCIFTGDTIFYRTYGRTDLPGGSGEEMLMSLYRIYALRGDYTLYPGHGIMTTLEKERKNNRYMRKMK